MCMQKKDVFNHHTSNYFSLNYFRPSDCMIKFNVMLYSLFSLISPQLYRLWCFNVLLTFALCQVAVYENGSIIGVFIETTVSSFVLRKYDNNFFPLKEILAE